MTNQSNSAAERSAHVTRGEKPAPAEWTVVRMPDGTWKLKSVVALEARIAELEGKMLQILEWHPTITTAPRRRISEIRQIAKSALEGGKE